MFRVYKFDFFESAINFKNMINSGCCYQMFLASENRVITFYVTSKDGQGNVIARICGTNKRVEFNENTLYQRELQTLVQTQCKDC